jgi:small GTP-binding protein
VAKPTEIRVPLKDITVSRHTDASIAVVGGPNSGKSTLFNRLTGMRQRIGNYPGVTVERHVGTLKSGALKIELVDLPGTHALSAHSIEEQIAIDVIFGRMAGTQPPDGVLAVVDATNLYQGLYLVQQLIELELPVLVALTMSDAAERAGLRIDRRAATGLSWTTMALRWLHLNRGRHRRPLRPGRSYRPLRESSRVRRRCR